MAWLGEELPAEGQDACTPFAPRCVTDLVEEAPFARRRNLFSEFSVVFMDITSIHFEGDGGQGPAQLSAAVGAVGENRPQEGKQTAGVAIQNRKGAVAVLDIGRVDGDGEDQADAAGKQAQLQ